MGPYTGTAVGAEVVFLVCTPAVQTVYLRTLPTSHAEIVCELEIAKNPSPSCLCCLVLPSVC